MNVPFVLRKGILKLLGITAAAADDRLVVVDASENDFLKTIAVADLAASTNAPSVATGTGAVTAQQALAGAVVHNLGASAAQTFSLPAATPGMRVKALVLAAQELRLDPNGTETIGLPSSGVQQAAGKYITADAVGESVELVCVTAGRWEPFGSADGTWTAEP